MFSGSTRGRWSHKRTEIEEDQDKLAYYNERDFKALLAKCNADQKAKIEKVSKWTHRNIEVTISDLWDITFRRFPKKIKRDLENHVSCCGDSERNVKSFTQSNY